jgi:hypothetical protein
LTLAPRWRHDWSRTVSTNLSGGATVVLSPEAGTKPMVGRFGRAAILYTYDVGTGFELSYATGVAASPLTGQVINSDQVTLQGFTPLSQHERVFLSASVGYLRGSFIDLTGRGNDQRFETGLGDVDVTWQPSPSGWVQLFARYQVVAQVSDVNALGLNPSFLRDLLLVGVQFSSTPARFSSGASAMSTGGGLVPRRFPQRVDGSDGATAERAAPATEPAVPAPNMPAHGGPSRWIYTTPARPPEEAD